MPALSTSPGHDGEGSRIDIVTSLAPAVFSGAVQAVVFNPMDRALYLRVQNRTPLFASSNWSHPFQGFGNAAIYRTIGSATYLFWQDESARLLSLTYPDLDSRRKQFCVGLVAGTLNGAMLNPIAVVKFRMWALGNEATFAGTLRQLWHDGGARVFARGINVSVARDVCFGVVYESLRREARALLGADDDGAAGSTGRRFTADCAAAMAASTVSSPLNYARNMIYGSHPKGCPLTAATLCRYLFKEVASEPRLTDRCRLVNARLNIGWGTLRLGVGMACGQVLFTFAQRQVVRLERHTPVLATPPAAVPHNTPSTA